MRLKYIVVAVLLALFLIILIQNTEVVTLRLFFWKVGMSQIILILLAMALGFVAGFIVSKATGSQRRKNLKAK